MRFGSIEHLQRWKAEGLFPAIHDDIFAAVAARARGRAFCDLGSCHGLLAERMKAIPGASVCAVEGNSSTIAQGVEHGINVPTLELRVTRKTLGRFCQFIEEHRVTVLVARRVMPELWGDDLAGGRLFSSLLAAAGVGEIFLEGRAKTANAVNALATIEAEAALFSSEYDLAWNAGSVAYLAGR